MSNNATYTNSPTPIAINRIQHDVLQLNEPNTLSIMDKEGIHFNFYGNQITTYYHQLLIGPEDTPYDGGFYIFKGQFPDNYPFHPMTMKTLTQGENVRKHPNLYVCGKCCFSFLGTWSGPPWTACQNPNSVAISMKSVMTKLPLENEPGWEDINLHKEKHKIYAKLITYFNLKWAVCNIVENIDTRFTFFKAPIIKHFVNKYSQYMATLEKYKSLDGMIEKSPVYNFSVRYDYSVLKNKFENLYNKYSIKVELPITNTIDETIDETIVNNINNNVSDESLATTKTSTRQCPSEVASMYPVGTIKKSTNNNKTYIVKEYKRNNKSYSKWVLHK